MQVSDETQIEAQIYLPVLILAEARSIVHVHLECSVSISSRSFQ
jgi:hypothetical protein